MLFLKKNYTLDKQKDSNCLLSFLRFLNKKLILILIVFISKTSILAQTNTQFTALPLDAGEGEAGMKAILNDFDIYTLPLADMYQTAEKQHNQWRLSLQFGHAKNWDFDLRKKNIFGSKTPLCYKDNKGNRVRTTLALQTFEGKLDNNAHSHVTLSIADNFVALTVFDGKNTCIVQSLRPTASQQTANMTNPEKVVMYRPAAIKKTHAPAASCAADSLSDVLQTLPLPAIPYAQKSGQDTCRETVLLALAADYGLLQKVGRIDLVAKYMAAVINAIQAPYNEAGLAFQISEIYVETCSSCNEFGTATNSFTLLNDFLNHAQTSNTPFANPYHVAQLWTARDIDGSTVGIAKLGGVCTQNRYCAIQDYSPLFDRMRALSAHEIGHTFNAAHDPSTSVYIMRPVISEFSTQFSPQSIQAINTCVQLRPCFTECETCKGPASLLLQNYTGSGADLQWTPGSYNQYRLRWKPTGAATWVNEITINDTIYHISNLDPCSGYDFALETICPNNIYSTAQTILHKGVYVPTQNISYPNPGSVQINWTNNTTVGAWPMQLRLRESGTATWLQTLDITANTYTFTGLDICKNYELSLRAQCADSGTYGRDTLLTLRGARAYNVSGEGLSPTQARMVYYTNNSAASYTLRARLQGTSTWLMEIPNAVAGTYYNLSGLTPCTSYEVQAQAYCGTTGGNVTSNIFQTATMGIQTAEISSCNPDNATYDLAVKIGHSHFGGNTLLINVNGNSYPFTYNTVGPQICTISGLPADNTQNFAITAQDATFPNQCASSIYFDAPRPQCECSIIWREDFDQCVFPAGWQNEPTGTNNAAYWQIGKTTDNHSLNGSCMAFFDDDAFDTDGGESVLLTTPVFDLSNYDLVKLQFLYNFHTIDGSFKVEVFDGSQWWQAAQLTASNCGFWGCNYDEADIDISAFLNEQLKIRFRYDDGGGSDWYIGIDSLQLCGYTALTPATCNADFYYPTDTICSNSGVIWPVISGQPGGVFTSTPATGLSLDPNNGSIDPQTSTTGNYLVSYTIAGACSTTFALRADGPCKVKIGPKLFLQGPYIGTEQMSTQLRAANLLPPLQPYNLPPWNYNGGESYVLSTLVPANAVDWVLLELRSAATPTTIVAQKAAILQSNGWVREVGAASADLGISFSNTTEGAYYLVIRHRNHMAVASASPLWLNAQLQTYDFSGAASAAFGALQIGVSGSKYALLSGDINGDGVISRNDGNRYFQQNNLTGGYFASDCNIDKSVNSTDFGLWRANLGRLTYPWLR